MAALLAVLYGICNYALFLFTFVYAIGFVGNLSVPKSIDSGTAGPIIQSLITDAILLGIFAVQHSVMARPGFKRVWTRLVPQSVERSTFVLFASLALLLLYRQWQPVVIPVWTVRSTLAATALDAIFWLGWGVVLASTFLISHFELFGLRQVFERMLRRQSSEPRFRTPLLYRYVRHPLYLGFLLAFWATPSMSAGHLLFSIATTGYILIAIQLEERDLIGLFGDQYRRYRRQVSMLLPIPGRVTSGRDTAQAAPAPRSH